MTNNKLSTVERHRTMYALSLFLLSLGVFFTGCTPLPPPESPSQKQPSITSKTQQVSPQVAESLAPQSRTTPFGVLDPQKVLESETSRAQCYDLQPPKVSHNDKGRRKHGRCQPQSLIYARCRTGLSTCRLGDTSPVQWFSCARKHGTTTLQPVPGSVMVLAANARRGMPTGHPVYVEQVTAKKDGTWLLRLSHTNYDRKCHLDRDATVLFNPAKRTATFETGPWKTWAHHLKVLGFILR